MAVEYLGILYGLDDVSFQKRIQMKQPLNFYCLKHHSHQHQHHPQHPLSHHHCQSHHHYHHLDHQAEEWEGLMKEADDGDGSLTYEEFVAMISNAQMKN